MITAKFWRDENERKLVEEIVRDQEGKAPSASSTSSESKEVDVVVHGNQNHEGFDGFWRIVCGLLRSF